MNLNSKELMVKAAFGASVADSIILAAQPDEWDENYRAHRTFVFNRLGDEFQPNCILSGTIFSAWYSDSGTAYCPANQGTIYIYSKGSWRREQVCTTDEKFQYVWGISGIDQNSDIIFVCSNRILYIRENGQWRDIPFSENGIHKCHGLAPDEIYITSPSAILLWNGNIFEEHEIPDDYPRAILVLSDTELLLVGNDYIHLWSDENRWTQLTTPASSQGNSVLRFQDIVYIATLEGVLKYENGQIEWANQFECVNLFDLGDGMLSASPSASHIFDGLEWARVNLPKLAKDENVQLQIF